MVREIDTLIVYVHGAFASKRSWNYVQKRVNRSVRGKATTAELYFEYDLQEDEAHVIQAQLRELVLAELKVKAPKKLILVGHSFGGVLCVAVARDLEPLLRDKLTLKTITMSSPFGGARIASLVAMFTPSSTFFKNISHTNAFMWNFMNRGLACDTHSFVTTRGRVRWIAGENDGVVTLDSQLHFKMDPKNTITLVDLNHFEILLSDNIAARIISEAVPLRVAA